jgi:hypothetical protein
MKTCKLFSAFTFLLIILSSCGVPVPTNYGIYLLTDQKFQNLNPQNTNIRGNLLESISGLKGSSGIFLKNFEYIIVFEKDINPKQIVLSKLQFQEGTVLHNFFGDSYADVNLWTSKAEIGINISPIEGKKDMYKVIPSQPLDSGFYAIHFGSLSNKEALDAFGKVAYDFVIGTSTKNYLSKEAMTLMNETTFTQHAKSLLSIANDNFNKKNYDQIHKIYLNEDGTTINNLNWNKMVIGFQNWFLQSGKIVSCKIREKQINENSGVFYLQTVYEKAGIVDEELIINKNNNSYYITFLGTK